MNDETYRKLPVIGIGASAGGLSALQRLFEEMETPLGAAFVVIQHLDPNHKSLMSEILGRHTQFAVTPAKQGEFLAADTVYVNPPGKSVRIERGRIVVEEPASERFHRFPIDDFFRSLASENGTASCGIVLSGTGSDGAAGLREIKEAGGVTMVQSPDEAEFDGMPRAAIDTGCVDIVETTAEIGQQLKKLLTILPEEAETTTETLGKLLELLAERTGYDFRNYKSGSLGRRIRRRMVLNKITDPERYVEMLAADADERSEMVKDLLIGVTRFFRDPAAWESLGALVIDPLIDRLADGDTLRAWTAGCATGEEAYTLAIVIQERIAKSGKDITGQIFATDLNHSAIAAARAGIYRKNALVDVTEARLTQWFETKGDSYKVVAPLREMIVFATQNVIADPPFSSVHLITCRNLLIYLDRAAQNRLIETFHFALLEQGHLILGQAESADSLSGKFEIRDKHARIYRRLPGPAELPSSARKPRVERADQVPIRRPEPLGSNAAIKAMLSRFVPPCVLVNEDFDIVSLHGEMDGYIGFRRGIMTSNFLSMVSDSYRPQAWTVLQIARREAKAAETRYYSTDPEVPSVTILAEPLISGGRKFFLVYFMPVTSPGDVKHAERTLSAEPESEEKFDHYQNEIALLQQQLQMVMEKGEISSEELQTANEEILSANEELQSSNEELETSREELQSLNQELATTNSQLESKIAELEAANDDLSSLINSTDVPTVFLDTDLNIRRFSARATALLRIRDGDLGRPLEDLVSRIDDPDLNADMRKVMESTETIECEVSGETGTYLRRVSPYFTRKNELQGVIVTYADVSRLRGFAERLKLQAKRQSSVVSLGRQALESEDVAVLLDRACSDLSKLLKADITGVQRYEANTNSFRLLAGSGWPRGLVGGTRVRGDELNELSFARGQNELTYIADFATERRFSPSQLMQDVPIASGLCLPIGPVGSTWGILTLFWKHAYRPDDDVILYATSVASILWLAISQAETKRLREVERAELQELIDGLPIMIAVVGRDMQVDVFNRAWQDIGVTFDETRGADLSELLGERAREVCSEILARPASEQHDGYEFDIGVPGKGKRTHLLYCVPRSQGQEDDGFFFAAIDIHERKESEKRNRVISAELDHRVKNILALVNTIARMTGRGAKTYEQFRDDFSNRIQSLARTHTHLAAEQWDGMDLRRLISDELQAYAHAEPDRYALTGPTIILNLAATQSLALAFHEMTTNAAKYGALARPDGALDVTWTIDGENLKLSWVESGVGSVSRPDQTGFGSTVIKNALMNQLDGAFDAQFGIDGLTVEIRLPLDKLCKQDEKDE